MNSHVIDEENLVLSLLPNNKGTKFDLSANNLRNNHDVIFAVGRAIENIANSS